MRRRSGGGEDKIVGQNEVFKFSEKTTGVRMIVEWICTSGAICDLDVYVLIYDEKARFIERLNFDKPISTDGSTKLEADIDNTAQTASHEEVVTIDFTTVHKHTAAMVLFVDGGARNFEITQRLILHCSEENTSSGTENLMAKVAEGAFVNANLFKCVNRPRHDAEGVVLCTLYKDGFLRDGSCSWSFRLLFDFAFAESTKLKMNLCDDLVIRQVPSFHKYRPRLFPSVKAICAILSSRALPRLKQYFKKGVSRKNGDVNIRSFTEMIFMHLYSIDSRVLDPDEAAYTVAVIQEMFCQMNFNEDAVVDWDEFTSFCIQTDLGGSTNQTDARELNNYEIAYAQDTRIKDGPELSNYVPLEMMRYALGIRRILVVQDRAERVLMFDDSFELFSILDPRLIPGCVEPNEKLRIYDCCYLDGRDLFVYCSSDHAITTCREFVSLSGKKVTYSAQHRINSSFLHLKLCWSEGSSLLCSVAADDNIFGWNLDAERIHIPAFHTTRHKDRVTDFLAIDEMGLFATCSMDQRIVLWSQTTRRVKGVLMGHRRGVRSMSYARGVLLSAGFESEARTWDLNTKEQMLLLRGHRFPIASARIMTQAQAGNDLRAVTVDDSGEFRLWNIFAKDRNGSGGAPLAEVLQVFNLHTQCIGTEKSQIVPIRFIETPYCPDTSRGTYSNIIAASPGLFHIVPEKTAAEFLAASCMCCVEPSGSMMTGIGKHLHKYDLVGGNYLCSYSGVDGADILCCCTDGYYGRRLFFGCSNGRLGLMNFTTGGILDSMVLCSKRVTAVTTLKDEFGNLMVFAGCSDGRLCCIEEKENVLSLHVTAEHVIGDSCGLLTIKAIESLKIVVVASGGMCWGIFDASTLRRVLLLQEDGLVMGIEIIGASGDKEEVDEHMAKGLPLERRNMVTVAVCSGQAIRIYSIDLLHVHIVATHVLVHPERSFFMATVHMLNCPLSGTLNYASSTTDLTKSYSRLGKLLFSSTDEGYVIMWRAAHLRKESLERFVAVRSETSTQFRSSLGCTATGPSTAAKQAWKASIKRVDMLLKMQTQANKSNFGISTNNRDVRGLSSIQKEDSISSFRAHNDEVPFLAPLHDNACIVTLSPDGFHRLWNVDASCMGELQLPNVPDKLKARKMAVTPGWRFFMERIPVTLSHVDFANRLVNEIVGENRKNDTPPSPPGRHRTSRSALLTTKASFGEMLRRNFTSGALVDRDSVQNEVRSHILKELAAPYLPTDKSKETTEEDFDTIERQGSGNSSRSSSPLLAKSGALPDQVRKLSAKQQSATKLLVAPRCMSADIRKRSTRDLSQRPSTSEGISKSEQACSPAINSHRPRTATELVGQSMFVRSTDSSSRVLRQQDSLWSEAESVAVVDPAFSRRSIAISSNEGIIDAEAHKVLLRVQAEKSRVESLNKASQKVKLRNPALSTHVTMPKLGSVTAADITFGAQKRMYKNASKNLVSKRLPHSVAQHRMCLNRIQENSRKVGSMLKIDDAAKLEVPMLPTTDRADEPEEKLFRTDSSATVMNSDGTATQIMIFSSEGEQVGVPKELDRGRIQKLMHKMAEAENATGAESDSVNIGRLVTKAARKRPTINRMSSAAETNVAYLEKKLAAAICSAEQGHVKPTPNSSGLTTRMLLPFYKLEDVQHFLAIFQKVDEDYSGELDVEEWCNFFLALHKNVSRKQATTIYNRLKGSSHGCLRVTDLLPVVFNNANKAMLALIQKYVDNELSRRKVRGTNFLTELDLETLFDLYDTNAVGFITAGLIKEKLRTFSIPNAIFFSLLDVLHNVDDDEMVNQHFFVRMFRAFCM